MSCSRQMLKQQHLQSSHMSRARGSSPRWSIYWSVERRSCMHKVFTICFCRMHSPAVHHKKCHCSKSMWFSTHFGEDCLKPIHPFPFRLRPAGITRHHRIHVAEDDRGLQNQETPTLACDISSLCCYILWIHACGHRLCHLRDRQLVVTRLRA